MLDIQDKSHRVMRDFLTGKSILIVDDDDDYAEALDEIFSLQGCRVTRLCDPVSAVGCALAHDFDLMIVDKNMPRLDGLEFATQIRRQKPSSKIVLTTACPNEESRKRSRDIGIRYYLTKPFRKNDILEIASFLLL
ncbi:MAG TPA: response regulator [bacterium]|nr:response regulator [Candidatus Omnitrophota bacterium]HOJ60134.1 response regulator [bacterium]HOL96374.1 response regulator [bacterium]HPP02014.1 response regulator [bacterium]HXK92927.1 response regulator [bacterium]